MFIVGFIFFIFIFCHNREGLSGVAGSEAGEEAA